MKLNPSPIQCPVCQVTLRVAVLECGACETRLHGHFVLPPLARLTADMQAFVEVFLSCRGNIREVEKALNLSYPTVRNRLEAVIEALGRLKAPAPAGRGNSREEVLAAVESGELSLDEALAQLERNAP